MTKFIASCRALLFCALFISAGAAAQPHLNFAVGLADPTESDFQTGGGIRVGAGYLLLEWLALEVAATDLGKFDGEGSNSMDIRTYEFIAAGTYPFGEVSEVFVKLGQHRWEADVKGSVTDFEDKDSGSDLVFGLGYAYVLDYQGAIRAEVNRYEVDKTEIDAFWLSFEARF